MERKALYGIWHPCLRTAAAHNTRGALEADDHRRQTGKSDYTGGRRRVRRFDADRNLLAFIRRNPWDYNSAVLVVLNFSPVSYHDYSAGVPFGGLYKRVFSTYDSLPGQGNPAEIGGIPPLTADWKECDGYSHRLTYSLRPFESVIFEFPT